MSEQQQYGRRAVEIGPTGKTVAENLTRLRRARGLSTRQLSAALEQSGRALSPSGITRMEKAERHVTADELLALAAVLRVNPSALLLPATTEGDFDVTGVGRVNAQILWEWADGERPLKVPAGDDGSTYADFQLHARPKYRRRYKVANETSRQAMQDDGMRIVDDGKRVRIVFEEDEADGPSVD
ncbi:helix-turn-helix domain-containing protein [Streptomyces sp. 3211]|uniref:helix-turn-helix domain-containing protein n=1 Tax=Streptomyces sp. 3211 TaxID=1964449 RepID=UPI0013313BC1|nr:helix-turn-helix domain-containing protein [Streptomyces sp. 3211]